LAVGGHRRWRADINNLFDGEFKMRFAFALTVLMAVVFAANAIAQIPYNTSPDWLSLESTDYGTGCDFNDINNDGYLDLGVSNGNDMALAPNYIYISQNGILPHAASWISLDEQYSGHCEFGDVNADGFPEFMVCNYISSGWGPGSIQFYPNNNGVIATSPSWITANPLYSFRSSYGDADGDGDLDLAVATGEAYNNYDRYNQIYYNVGGNLQTTPGWQSADLDASYDVQFVDIENDGDLDVAFLTSGGRVKIYYNTNGVIATTPGWQTAANDNGNSFDFADLNGDGYVDMGVAFNSQLGGSGRFKIYYSANGVLHTTADWQSSTAGYGSEAVFSDVDNDGDFDMICGRWWGQVDIYINNAGVFSTSPSWSSSPSYNSVVENIIFGDVNNSGENITFKAFPGDGQRKLFYLGDRHLQSVESVVADGQTLPLSAYCYHLKNGWVSLATAPTQRVAIYYRNSNHKDLAVSNWDNATFIFTNASIDPTMVISMLPYNPPLSVPAGGSFSYTGILTSKFNQPQTPDVWLMLDVPGYGIYGPLMQFNNVPLGANQTISVPGIVQHVPGYAPLGVYEYIAYCGDYPSNPVNSYSFEFTVTAPLEKGGSDWAITPWFENEASAVPVETAMSNNYPNPFNAQTTITYALPNDSDVKLEIYNVLGQKVTTLVDAHQTAGYQSITWDANSYASGIYFYKLDIGDNVFTKRMTLLK